MLEVGGEKILSLTRPKVQQENEEVMFSRTSQPLALKTPGSGVDFHMHTLASDGLWTTEKLVDTVYSQGVRTLTVSDHDTIKNVRPVQELAARRGVNCVPGVEMTREWIGAM